MTGGLVCFHCNTPQSEASRSTSSVGFRDTCPKCHSDLHVCRNCSFFDEGAHHECRESSAEWVKDKERANRCEYFRSRSSREGEGSKSDALSALDALFKK